MALNFWISLARLCLSRPDINRVLFYCIVDGILYVYAAMRKTGVVSAPAWPLDVDTGGGFPGTLPAESKWNVLCS